MRTESAQLRFRGQTRARMKGHQIAGEWTPNYARRFCFPRAAYIGRHIRQKNLIHRFFRGARRECDCAFISRI